MNIFKFAKYARLMKPADDGNSGAGAAEPDRGDHFEPTEAALAEEAAKAAKPALTDEEAEAEREKLGLGAKPAEKPAAKEGEAKDGEEEEDPKADKKKDSRIPLSRHTEILQRERAARELLEAELAEARKGQAKQQTDAKVGELETKLADLEEKYAVAMTDGDTKAAQALMKEIRVTERTVIEQQAAVRTQEATNAAVEQVRFDATVERLETAYPQLKVGSDTFDQALVSEVLELKGAFVLQGLTHSAALQKAVGYVIRPASVQQEKAINVTPRVDADAAVAAAAKADREAAARKRGVAAADAQPPALGKDGANSDTAGGALDAKAVMKMSNEQFSKLSEEDLSRLRGDIL